MVNTSKIKNWNQQINFNRSTSILATSRIFSGFQAANRPIETWDFTDIRILAALCPKLKMLESLIEISIYTTFNHIHIFLKVNDGKCCSHQTYSKKSQPFPLLASLPACKHSTSTTFPTLKKGSSKYQSLWAGSVLWARAWLGPSC